MSEMPVRQQTLVSFDHWSWLLFVAWFAVGTLCTFAGLEWASAIVFWGIVAVLVNNLVRLLLLAGFFKGARKVTYYRFTVLLILVLIISILFQLWMRQQL